MDMLSIAVITLVALLVVGLALALNRKGWRASEATVKTPLGEMKFQPPPAPALPRTEGESTSALRPAREFGHVSPGGDFVARDKTIHGDEVRGDKVGGDKADTIIKDSKVYLPQPPAPTPPHGYVPPLSASRYVERGLEDKICAQLTAGDGVAALVSVSAPGGVGKSELAKVVAARLRPQFEDVFWIDLNDKTPAQVVNAIALALRITFTPNADEAQRLGELQAQLAGRHYLFVLDDVREDNRALLADFLPPPPCATLITSRIQQLSPRIPANATHRLGRMDEAQARALLEGALGAERVQAEAQAAAQLMTRCKYNPLALDIAARRIRQLADDGMQRPLAVIAQKVQQRLSELQAGDGERASLFAVFSISYDDLTPADQARFRRLAVFAPTGFGVPAAAHLWGESADDASAAILRLQNLSLLKVAEALPNPLPQVEGAARQNLPRPGTESSRAEQETGTGGEVERYRLHDLLDEYATECLQAAREEAVARDTHAQWLIELFTKHAMDGMDNAPHVTLELDNLRAAVKWAAEARNGSLLASLATAPRNWLFNFFRINDEWLAWLNTARQLGISDTRLEANTLKSIGEVQQFRDDYDGALASYQQALALFRAVGERIGEANTLKSIGEVQQFRADYDAALASYQQALALYRAVGERLGEANTLKSIGDVQRFRADYDAALASYQQALTLYRAVGERLGEANTLSAQGQVYVHNDDERGTQLLNQAIAIYTQIGDRYSIPAQIGNFGWALLRSGDPERARPYLLKAADLFEQIGLLDYAKRHRDAANPNASP